jgi:hypothetical protein
VLFARDTFKPKGIQDAIPDMNGNVWKAAIGDHGPYEKCEQDPGNPSYTQLLKALSEHGGRMTIDTFFVWTFSDGKTIGRKQKT